MRYLKEFWRANYSLKLSREERLKLRDLESESIENSKPPQHQTNLMTNDSENNPLNTRKEHEFLHQPQIAFFAKQNFFQIFSSQPQNDNNSTAHLKNQATDENSMLFLKDHQKTHKLIPNALNEPITQQKMIQGSEDRMLQPENTRSETNSQKFGFSNCKTNKGDLVSNVNQIQNCHHTSDFSPIRDENQILNLDENSLFATKVRAFGDHVDNIKGTSYSSKANLFSLKDKNSPRRIVSIAQEHSTIHHLDFNQAIRIDRSKKVSNSTENVFKNFRISNYAIKNLKEHIDLSQNARKLPSETFCSILKTQKRNFPEKLNTQSSKWSEFSIENEKREYCKNLFAMHFSNHDNNVEQENDDWLLQRPAKKLFQSFSKYECSYQLNDSVLSTAENSKNPSNRSSSDQPTQPKYFQDDSINNEMIEPKLKSVAQSIPTKFESGNFIQSPCLSNKDVKVFIPEDMPNFLSSVCMFKHHKNEHTKHTLKDSRSLLEEDSTDRSSRFSADFQKCEALGSGDCGTVYRCINRLDGLEYAVKAIPQRKRGILRIDKALNEVHAHAYLTLEENLFIVRYYGAWAEKDFFYIVMEYCPSNLKNIEKLDMKFSESMIRSVMRDICQGLHQLHRMNIAHLDIKPENILLSRSGRYKIADLGLSRVADRKADEDVDEGDSRYLALEFLNDFSNVDQNASVLTKADIFSLGVTIYELMIGEEMPKNGGEWRSIRNGVLPKLDKLNNYSDSLKDLVRLMMSSNPQLRPSAEELISTHLLSDMELELKWEKTEKKLIKQQLIETETKYRARRKNSA